jgi:formyl-CoA transferase
VIIGAFKENPLQRICAALELPDLSACPGFADLEAQRTNRSELRGLIAERLRERETAHWLAALEGQDVLCGPVLTLAEALASEQTEVNGMVLEFPDAGGRVIRTVSSPIRMSAAEAETRIAPPQLGQHSRQILTDAGYSQEQIRRLFAGGAVQ